MREKVATHLAKPKTPSSWKVVTKTTTDFANTSAISGLSNAANSQGLLRKIIWLVIFAFGVFLTTKDVINVFQSYFSYPFATQVNVIHTASIEFPEITVCNQNRVSCKKLLILSLQYYKYNPTRFNNYFQMYFLAKCGIDGLGCDTVRDIYYAFKQLGKEIPVKAYNDDECLSCVQLWQSFHTACVSEEMSEDYASYYIGKLNEYWTQQDCGKKNYSDYHMLHYENCTNVTTENGRQYDQFREKRDVGPLSSIDYSEELVDTDEEYENLIPPSHSAFHDNQIYEKFSVDHQTSPKERVLNLGRTLKRSIIERDNSLFKLSYLVDNNALDTVDKSADTDDTEKDDVLNTVDNITNKESTSASPSKTTSQKPTSGNVYKKASIYGVPSESYNKQIEFLMLYMSLTVDERRDIGYTKEELILDCNFMEYKCDMRLDFINEYSALYGNCFTYKQVEGKKTSLTSSIYGLSMVLNIDQDSYLPRLLTPNVGARMSIQRATTRPQLEDNAINLDIGKASSVAVQKLDLHRLRSPYQANCSELWEETTFGLSPDIQRYENYTVNDCLRMCLQRFFIESCGCSHPLYPQDFMFGTLRYKGYKLCNLTDGHWDYFCSTTALNKFATLSENDVGCECDVECNEIAYSLALTSATWPPIVSDKTIADLYNKSGIEKNLLKVDIYFSSLNVDEVKQRPVYPTTSDFIGSLGGALGLWLGISVILMGEVLEYLALLLWNFGLNCCGYFDTKDEKEENGKK